RLARNVAPIEHAGQGISLGTRAVFREGRRKAGVYWVARRLRSLIACERPGNSLNKSKNSRNKSRISPNKSRIFPNNSRNYSDKSRNCADKSRISSDNSGNYSD